MTGDLEVRQGAVELLVEVGKAGAPTEVSLVLTGPGLGAQLGKVKNLSGGDEDSRTGTAEPAIVVEHLIALQPIVTRGGTP